MVKMSTMTHIAFTICSNNYLGQALALKDSFLRHHPSFKFYIVLVDKRHPSIDYDIIAPAKLLPIADIEGIDLDDLITRYYIIELNTAVKPSVFKHLAKKHPQTEALYYLDPDLFFYDSLKETNRALHEATAVLTPHVLSPIPRDGKQPDENTFFRFGIYNLGFLGIDPSKTEAKKLLDWWEERVLKFGYDRPNKGYFVDQLWMALAPLFFEGVEVIHSYGYNMAPWNLHERRIVSRGSQQILMNDNSTLVFYHFSKLSDNDQDISREYDRYTFKDIPFLKELYEEYRGFLHQVGHEKFKKISIAYSVKKNPTKKEKSWLGHKLERLAQYLIRLSRKI